MNLQLIRGRWQSDIVGNLEDGYGLVQWTPATKYINWVEGDPSEMDNNLSRILYEVKNEIQWIPTAEFPFSFEEFTKSTMSPYDLAMAFLKNYERPYDPDQPSRGTQAEEWYSFLGGVNPPRPEEKKKTSFKWVVFINKIRKKRRQI